MTPLEAKNTLRQPASGSGAWRNTGAHAGSHAEIGWLLAHLKQRRAELDRASDADTTVKRPTVTTGAVVFAVLRHTDTRLPSRSGTCRSPFLIIRSQL